MNLIIIKK